MSSRKFIGADSTKQANLIQPDTTSGTIRVVVRPRYPIAWNDKQSNFNIINGWSKNTQIFFIRKYTHTKSDEKRLQFVIRNKNDYLFSAFVPLNENYNHNHYLDLVLSWDDHRAWAYINGKLINQTVNLRLDASWDTTELKLGGGADFLEVTTFNRALTGNEVYGLYKLQEME